MQENDRQSQAGMMTELFGAIADSFTRERTARLTRLEERLARLRYWAVIGMVVAFAYLGYELWGELRAESGAYLTGSRSAVAAAESSDEARSSIYLIFAAAVGGPIGLIVGYMLLGFFYNLLRDALIKRVPLARFLVIPALLLMGLMLLDTRREELKLYLFEGYARVERHIASARSLRTQAKVAGEQLQALRQREAQWQGQTDEGESESLDSPSPTLTAGDSRGEEISEDEAVRRLGEMMLQLQGMSLQQPNEGGGQSPAEIQPNPVIDTAPAPALESIVVPSPSTPADI